jgi:hypothetical protein
MWLFTGRYAQLGPAICIIALGVAAVGLVFVGVASRLVRRGDVGTWWTAGVILAVTAAAAFDGAFGEPVFVANSLNRGAALILAIVGVLLGAGGAIVSSKRRLLGALLLVAASGILFGDLAGWLLRSAGQTYRQSIVTRRVAGAPPTGVGAGDGGRSSYRNLAMNRRDSIAFVLGRTN